MSGMVLATLVAIGLTVYLVRLIVSMTTASGPFLARCALMFLVTATGLGFILAQF